jgi:hypothetical protein
MLGYFPGLEDELFLFQFHGLKGAEDLLLLFWQKIDPFLDIGNQLVFGDLHG